MLATLGRMMTSQAFKQLKYLLILDFEATCGEPFPRGEQEIIEFPTLVYGIQEKRVLAEFRNYIKPTYHPTLTEFCTQLTGIRQATVDNSDSFPAVWSRYHGFLESNGVLDDTSSYMFLTCGDWDLRTMLPMQHDYSAGIDPSVIPVHPIFRRWINVKDAFARHYELRHGKGMIGMLKQLTLQLEGRHHSGLDDCRNIARIVKKMQEDGWEPAESKVSTVR